MNALSKFLSSRFWEIRNNERASLENYISLEWWVEIPSSSAAEFERERPPGGFKCRPRGILLLAPENRSHFASTKNIKRNVKFKAEEKCACNINFASEKILTKHVFSEGERRNRALRKEVFFILDFLKSGTQEF
mgnify:CR=1 FL=1